MSDQQDGMEHMEALYEKPLLCPAGFPVPEGTKEWTVEKGDKGERGERGERGASRLPFRLAWAIVVLFAVAAAMGGTALFSAAAARHSAQQAVLQNNREQAAQVASQHKQDERTLSLLCTTFGRLAADKPPAGNPATNPSRAFDQKQHYILDELGQDLGCNGGTR